MQISEVWARTWAAVLKKNPQQPIPRGHALGLGVYAPRLEQDTIDYLQSLGKIGKELMAKPPGDGTESMSTEVTSPKDSAFVLGYLSLDGEMFIPTRDQRSDLATHDPYLLSLSKDSLMELRSIVPDTSQQLPLDSLPFDGLFAFIRLFGVPLDRFADTWSSSTLKQQNTLRLYIEILAEKESKPGTEHSG